MVLQRVSVTSREIQVPRPSDNQVYLSVQEQTAFLKDRTPCDGLAHKQVDNVLPKNPCIIFCSVFEEVRSKILLKKVHVQYASTMI